MLQSLAIPAVPKTPHLIFSIFFLLGISILLFSAIFDNFSFFRAAHKPMLFSEFHEKHSSQYFFLEIHTLNLYRFYFAAAGKRVLADSRDTIMDPFVFYIIWHCYFFDLL